jgi:hypothetical protein
VLIRPGEAGVVNDDAAPHVHHVADDLAVFLQDLSRRARGG